MIEYANEIWQTILDMGEKHNVNPIVFAILYVGSIPPYLASIAWVVKNVRNKKSLPAPIISTLFFFIVPSLYILVFGEDVAWWIYVVVVLMVVYGAFATIQKIKRELRS